MLAGSPRTVGILHKTIGYTQFLPLESAVGFARRSTTNDGGYAASLRLLWQTVAGGQS